MLTQLQASVLENDGFFYEQIHHNFTNHLSLKELYCYLEDYLTYFNRNNWLMFNLPATLKEELQSKCPNLTDKSKMPLESFLANENILAWNDTSYIVKQSDKIKLKNRFNYSQFIANSKNLQELEKRANKIYEATLEVTSSYEYFNPLSGKKLFNFNIDGLCKLRFFDKNLWYPLFLDIDKYGEVIAWDETGFVCFACDEFTYYSY